MLEFIWTLSGEEKMIFCQPFVAGGRAATSDTISAAVATSGSHLKLKRRLSIQISSYRKSLPASKWIYCLSYSPLLTFLSTVNPAFLASEMDSGLSLCGVLKPEMILRTGFLQAGQFVSGLADSGRFKREFPAAHLALAFAQFVFVKRHKLISIFDCRMSNGN